MDGIVTVLKPPGMSSSNAVFDTRRIFEEKHAGHLGTLDPGAAGVLPVTLGRAAKLFDILVDKQKDYLFEVFFGVSTDTLDTYGAVTKTMECSISQEQLAAALPLFRGKIRQTPPAYSALKVDGKKMYDLARSGLKIPDRSREVEIISLELLRRTGANRFLLECRCSRGTYIRSLAEDLGKALGVPAVMSFLLRTASGNFTLDRSYSIPELEECKGEGRLEEAVTSCEEALGFLPSVALPSWRRKAAMNALSTTLKQGDAPEGLVRLYCEGFLGVGRVSGDSVKLEVHLY